MCRCLVFVQLWDTQTIWLVLVPRGTGHDLFFCWHTKCEPHLQVDFTPNQDWKLSVFYWKATSSGIDDYIFCQMCQKYPLILLFTKTRNNESRQNSHTDEFKKYWTHGMNWPWSLLQLNPELWIRHFSTVCNRTKCLLKNFLLNFDDWKRTTVVTYSPFISEGLYKSIGTTSQQS